MRDLVNQVLERARSGDLSLKSLDASELLEGAWQGAKARYGHAAARVGLRREVESGLRLKVDEAQMERVLQNLLLNALQALGPGGELTLEARRQAEGTLLSVSDNGPGIPEDTLERVFEPFFTTKRTGSGLGLWICKSIVEQHRGRLEAANLKPRGCRFSIILPPDPGAA
jgi:signal transduction histidine kinase